MCVYICVCVCVCVYIYVYVCVYVCIYMCVCVRERGRSDLIFGSQCIHGSMVVPQELVNMRDGLEKQLHTLTVQLGKVEEQRILAAMDVEKMKVPIC